MGCALSKKTTNNISMKLIISEDGIVPMPIGGAGHRISGTVELSFKNKKKAMNIGRINSRKELPSNSIIHIKRIGNIDIAFGDATFVWDNKLGLQVSTKWNACVTLQAGFGKNKSKTAARPKYKRGDELIFELGESSPVHVVPRKQGTYARDGSDLDLKNWTRTRS
jgi:hypothetical protein